MKKYITGLFCLFPFLMSGCNSGYEKTASLTVVYAITAVLSLVIFLGYLCAFRKKDPWYILLFGSVLVVNVGYFLLAVSRNLDTALLANSVAYLGSAFLPISMWMILLRVGNFSYRKRFPIFLLCLAFVMFLLASSPSYCDLYYKEVSFVLLNGMGALQKVYGPLHILYLFYLLGTFGAMVSSLVYSVVKDKIQSAAYGIILAIAVFANISVWLIEQFVSITFELLSISYIISELFLLGLHLLIAEHEKQEAPVVSQVPPAAPLTAASQPDEDQLVRFAAGVQELTQTERLIFDAYISGKTTKEIMEYLNIKENTLKFHNKNIYGKLGVSSRKQLIYLHSCRK